MEDLYREKTKELEKENAALRKKIKLLEDQLFSKLGMHHFYIKNVDQHIKKFILSCQNQLQIITCGFDLKFAEIFKNLANDGKKLQLITLERHQLNEQELINAFDRLQGSLINIYTNQNVRANLIIKDVEQLLITSTVLYTKKLVDDLNYCIISLEKQVVEQFQKYFNNHLPQFLRD